MTCCTKGGGGTAGPAPSALVAIALAGCAGHVPVSVQSLQPTVVTGIAPPKVASGAEQPSSGAAHAAYVADTAPSGDALVAGGSFTCVRGSNGHVSCCGNGWHGELGNGDHEDEGSPVTVQDIDDAVDLAAGVFHACVRRANGHLWCWGENRWGQLGYRSYPDSKVAREVPGAERTTQMSLGILHSCARRDDGVALCWGRNNVGQAGTGTVSEQDAPPAPVVGLGPVAQVAVGWDASCALALDGTVRCWGLGVPLLRGAERGARLWTPARMPARVTALALGSEHLCALDGDGALWCGGNGQHGQLCDGSSPPRSNTFPPPP